MRWFCLLALALTLNCCYFDLPVDPPRRYCAPGRSWQCNPAVEWAEM